METQQHRSRSRGLRARRLVRRIVGAALATEVLWAACAHSPRPSETGTLVGKVVDERARAIGYARVRLEGISEESVTGEDGSFQFPELHPGTYAVEVRAPSLNSRFKEGVRIEAGRVTAVELVLTEPSPRHAAEPTYPEARVGAISGKVVDEDGRGLQGAAVLVLNTGLGASTDSKGHYGIPVPIGTHTVRCLMAGRAKVDREGVRVSEGDTTTVEFRLLRRKVKMSH